MPLRLAQIREHLRSSLWVVPTICTRLTGLRVVALSEVATRFGALSGGLPWTFVGGAESARAGLSTSAGSMITVAGTVYSITAAPG
jgi:uncharacterized membrane protein